LISDDLKRVLKEVALAYLKYYPGIYLMGLRKTTVNLRIAGLRDDIHTEHLLNKSVVLPLNQ
jgi:hypothetical protein